MKNQNTNVQKLVNDKKQIFESALYFTFEKFLLNHLKNKKFAIAVSGGPDSLALVHLANLYTKKYSNKFIVLMVDHGVRKSSGSEVKKVKVQLEKYQIPTKVFKLNFKSMKNFHAKARELRYQKMSNYCKKNKIPFLLLAHHYDDQIENFYIRLSRGSGLSGLSPMKVNTRMYGVNFLRPFLFNTKEELLKITKNNFKYYVKDPSNMDDKYLRSRVRKFKLFLDNEGGGQNRLMNTLNNLDQARQAIDHYTSKSYKNCITYKSQKEILIKKALFKEPNEIIFRCISNLFTNQKKIPPRAKGISRLIHDLQSSNNKNVTLGGYLFKNHHKTVKVLRENRVK